MVVSNLDDIVLDSPTICIDLETQDLNLKSLGPGAFRGDASIVGIGIGTISNQYYIPIDHNDARMDLPTVIQWLNKEVIKHKYCVGANIVYDLEFLECSGFNIDSIKYLDVQYAEALLNGQLKHYSLDAIGTRYLNQSKKTNLLQEVYSKLYGPTVLSTVYKNLRLLPASIVGQYCCGDVLITLLCLKKQLDILKRDGLYNLFLLECQLIAILLRIRKQGVKIDTKKLTDSYIYNQKEINRLESELYSVNGRPFNINSTNELGDLLVRQGLTLDKPKKSKYLKYSIDRKWLETHKDGLVTKNVYEYRRLIKETNTFLMNYMIKKINKDRIRSQFHPLRTDSYGTVTGRFSSSMPNLQNIPSSEIRELFIANNENDKWVCVDRNQIEYRLLCNFAVGIGAVGARTEYITNADTDFHKYVMELTGLERKPAKICNFLLVYYGGIGKLADVIGSDAINVYAEYHNNLPFVKATQHHYEKLAKMYGETRTVLNRRRVLSFENSYKGLNSFIQGSAADIMKIDLIELNKSGIFSEIGYPLLTVHDELDFSIPQDKLGLLEDVRNIMEEGYKKYVPSIKVPLTVTIRSGLNWYDLK